MANNTKATFTVDIDLLERIRAVAHDQRWTIKEAIDRSFKLLCAELGAESVEAALVRYRTKR